MLPQEKIDFLLKTPSGKLEVCEIKPQTPAFSGIGIICHPHPLQGGTMHNKVVTTIAKMYRESSQISVQFNFRGVGKSEGSYDHGIGEIQDTLNIIDWAKKRYPELPVYLAGFSFGAYVSLNAAVQTKIPLTHLITIAPAVNHADFSGLIPPCPWTIAIAGKDNVVPFEDIYTWLKILNPDPAPKVFFFPEATHFFDGQLINLKQQLKPVLKQIL